MKFNKGDLVVHAQGSLFPEGQICGVVMDIFGNNRDFYKVFWYTMGRYQNLREDNLRHIKEIK